MTRKAIWVGLALFVGGVVGTAAFSMRKSPALFPGMSVARYRFDGAHAKPLDNTIPALEARVKMNASRPSAIDLAELASLYFQQGHLSGDLTWYDKAETTAKRSLEVLPSPNQSRLTLAKIADAKHQFPEAIRIAAEILKDHPTQGALGVMVSSYLAMGNLPEAARYADQAVDFKPETTAYLMRALVMAAQGRDDEAAFDFQRAATVEDLGGYSESARLRALWGRFLTRHGDYKNAADLFDESLRILPDNHLALALRGEMELQRGDYKVAQKYLMDAFSASKQLRYLIHYARAKALAGDPKAAGELRTMAEKLVRDELNSKAFGHRLELVEILLDKGGKENIEEAVKLARDELKVRQSSEAQYQLARALFAADRPNEAIEPIRAALRTGVKDPEYFSLAATIERTRGNGPHAGFYQSFAKRLNPAAG